MRFGDSSGLRRIKKKLTAGLQANSILLIISGFPGENINICWSPDGQTIAVGNKDDVVTFIDAKTHRSKAEEQFKFEVNEISWNNDNNMFFLTNGNGCINILR